MGGKTSDGGTQDPDTPKRKPLWRRGLVFVFRHLVVRRWKWWLYFGSGAVVWASLKLFTEIADVYCGCLAGAWLFFYGTFWFGAAWERSERKHGSLDHQDMYDKGGRRGTSMAVIGSLVARRSGRR